MDTDDVALAVIVDPFTGRWWRQHAEVTGVDLAYTRDLFRAAS